MKKIRTVHHGVRHYTAFCAEDCGWEACKWSDETPSEEAVRRAARQHVLKTGHVVTVHSTKATCYELETDPP